MFDCVCACAFVCVTEKGNERQTALPELICIQVQHSGEQRVPTEFITGALEIAACN